MRKSFLFFKEALLTIVQACAQHIPYRDNHHSVVIQLEPDILEGEVKWALGSITTNKANGSGGNPADLF